jgi:hypothetical protein
MNTMTTHERALIEYLGYGQKTYEEISQYFAWSNQLITNCLNSLIKEKYVHYKNSFYSINIDQIKENKNESINREVNDLVEKMTNNFFMPNESTDLSIQEKIKPQLMLKKFYMTKEDLLLLNGMLKQINEILESAQKNNQQNCLSKKFDNQFVYFSALMNYQQVLNQAL